MAACLLLSAAPHGDPARAPFMASAFAQAGSEVGRGGGRSAPVFVSIGYTELRETLRRMSQREARQWSFELLIQHESPGSNVVLVGFSDWMTPHILDMIGTIPDLLEETLRRLDGITGIDDRKQILQDLLDQIQRQLERLQDSFDQDTARGFLPEGSLEKSEAQVKMDRLNRARRYAQDWRDNPEQGLISKY
jgi:hypothetical protein